MTGTMFLMIGAAWNRVAVGHTNRRAIVIRIAHVRQSTLHGPAAPPHRRTSDTIGLWPQHICPNSVRTASPLNQLDKKRQRKLQRETGKAVTDFNMIDAGDRIMVCLSGGKDSYVMLDMLLHLQRVAPINFDLIAVNLDQKQPGFPAHVLPEYLDSLNVEHLIVEEDTYSIVKEKIPEGQTTCGLCSRLRRGILYKTADTLEANKIALGHHADDALETLLLNLFYGGSIKSMPAKLHADNGQNIVIRPLAYCREADIASHAHVVNYPIIPCTLCGSQPNLQRQAMKALLNEWEQTDPSRIASMLTGLKNVTPSHLHDKSLYDFDANQRMGEVESTSAQPAKAKADNEEVLSAFNPRGTEIPLIRLR